MVLLHTELGKVEDEIFKNRRQKEQDFRRRQKLKKRRTGVRVLQHIFGFIINSACFLIKCGIFNHSGLLS